MNLAKLQQNVGQRLRLVPPAFAWSVEQKTRCDDEWTLIHVGTEEIRLRNDRTGHEASLAPDHVHHFASAPPAESGFDGILELNVTIDISSKLPTIHLIPSGAARTLDLVTHPPLDVRARMLLDRINPEILRTFARGAQDVAVMISERNLRHLQELQQEEGFADLLSVTSTGSMATGIGATVGGHVSDLDQLGTRHGFVLHPKGGLG